MSQSPGTAAWVNVMHWVRGLYARHPRGVAMAALLSAYMAYRAMQRRKSVRGKIVLITGAARKTGLGANMARAFAKLGAKVVLWDHPMAEEELEARCKEITKLVPHNGGGVWKFIADMCDRQSVMRAVKEMVDNADLYPTNRLSSNRPLVDILINNAGVVSAKEIEKLTEKDIDRTFKVNVISHFWMIKAFLPSMAAANSGHIVTIASGAGQNGVPTLTDYCASKFAAVGLDESLRVELKHRGLRGIKTTCVMPYYINTGMFDGVKTRFNFLLPILQPDYATRQIVHAILTDTPVLKMPWLLYFSPLFRFLLPPVVADFVADFLGVSSSMDEFKAKDPLRPSVDDNEQKENNK
eukprot:TRINITY_DN67580_c6_g14_i2.p2 TRINITY_DN67580_c6_g14~~TRINITY_DN67580_c6_g14_i2.p2  ORF type:complete len:353 (+),score=177.39 TRINITY_DN67580_c6_g14_i2:841-1899(+)